MAASPLSLILSRVAADTSPAQWMESARKQLLNLTLRNPLLNMRDSERSLQYVDIHSVSPQYAFEALVNRGSGSGLALGMDGLGESEFPTPFPEEEFNEADPAEWIPALPDLRNKGSRTVCGSLPKERLAKVLLSLFRQSGSHYEEHGHSILFMALGALCWSRPRGDRVYKAPLLLVPCRLIHANSRLRVKWNEDEVRYNLSLWEKMRADEEIHLPPFEKADNAEELTKWFAKVGNHITAREGWHLAPVVRLGLFKFTKTLMWEDLNPEHWNQTTESAEEDGGPGGEVLEEWTPRPPLESYEVLDSDRYQDRVLQAAAQGKSFVVQGPPGTGKSQTVVNLIADTIARGKSVLFVSDKMAALDVVTTKLDLAGLGAAVLDLHSHKAKPKHVLEQLEQQVQWTESGEDEAKAHLERLVGSIDEVDEFREAMLSPAVEGGPPTHEALGMALGGQGGLGRLGAEVPFAAVPKPNGWTPQDLTVTTIKGSRAMVGTATQSWHAVAPLQEHPWHGTTPKTWDMEVEIEFQERLTKAKEVAGTLGKARESLEEMLGVSLPSPNEDQSNWQGVLALGESAPPCGEALAKELWQGEDSKAVQLAALVGSFQALALEIGGRVKAKDPKSYRSLLLDIAAWESNRLRWVSKDYWSWRKEEAPGILSLGKLWRLGRARALLNLALKMDKTGKEVAGCTGEGAGLYGKSWRGAKSDLEQLAEVREWVLALHEFADPSALAGWQANGKTLHHLLVATHEARAALGKDLDGWERGLGPLLGFLGLSASPLQEVSTWEDAKALVSSWEAATHKLQEWFAWSNLHKGLGGPSRQALDWALDQGWASDAVGPALEFLLGTTLFRESAKGSDALNKCTGEHLENVLHRFRELDKKAPAVNVDRVRAQLFRNFPVARPGSEEGEAADLIRRQVQRKRGHMPIKKLFKKTLPYLTRVFPCFVMTPLSVAQYLTQDPSAFDLLIFDEASQVRPEDALGAMLRAKQVVVVGDSK